MSASKVMDEFIKISETLSNPYIDAWKEQGKKVLGYNCSYLPEEIPMAAGLLPYRIKGTGCTETTLADSFLASVNCSFCRASLEHLMQGKYDFLDGATFVYSCDHMCVTHTNWKAQGKIPFMDTILSVPHTVTPYGLDWYTEEIINLKDKIESHFEVEITEDKLKEAIAVCNETQRLQKELYALRTEEAPPITGSEALSVIVAGTSMPRDQYNQLLSQLITELKNKDGLTGHKYRLMLAGSEVDEPALFNIIEDLNALVVSDALCFGARSFRDPVKEDMDPMDAIAAKYYHQLLCPRMFDSYEQRVDFFLDIAKKSNVDGIILQNIKYCDLHGVDNVMLKRDFEKNGIPVLTLEREYSVLADAGRIRTRVQAFLEQIGR